MKVAVVGWYGHQNLGDEAFRPVFEWLFENHEIDFLDCIPNNLNYDVLVVGGGSFLDEPVPGIFEGAKNLFPHIAFIGVGIHSSVHPDNQDLLRAADVLVVRNEFGLPPDLPPVQSAPDLVFARQFPQWEPSSEKKLCVITNGFWVPGSESSWCMVASWVKFMREFGRDLDRFIGQGWSVSFVPMCAGEQFFRCDDRLASMHIASEMSEKARVILSPITEDELVEEIRTSSMVISTRFHGCVLATLTGTPFVGVSGHDKFLSFFEDNKLDNWINYHEYSYGELESAMYDLPRLSYLREITEKGFARWQDMRRTIRDVLSL